MTHRTLKAIDLRLLTPCFVLLPAIGVEVFVDVGILLNTYWGFLIGPQTVRACRPGGGAV